MSEKSKIIPLFKPYIPDLPNLDDVLKSGKLGYGKYSMLFESELKKYFSNEFLLVTNSYSSAIDVLMATIGAEKDDEVIMSPMCCLASSQPYISKGMRIVWADIDPKTGTLLPQSVEERITPRTKLIVHNHFCGYPGYIDEINQIGKKYNVLVLDDGIECFGSKYKNKLVGNCGTDFTVFSLSPVRIPNTIEGGVITFKSREMFQKARLVSDLGIDRQKFRDALGEIDTSCDVSLIGFNAKMSNVNGYLGFQYMKSLNHILDMHAKNAKKWDEILAEEYEKITVIDGCVPNYWVYGFFANDKEKTIESFREKGYLASGVHVDNSRYSVFNNKVELPGVKQFEKSFVAIPCGWWVTIDGGENEKQ